MIRILITEAGGSAGHNFIDSLRQSKDRHYLVGADVKPYHLELAPVDKRYLVPLISDPDYLRTLHRIIEKEKIDFVHSQTDTAVAFMARHHLKLKAKTFLPPYSVIELCHNKMAFNQRLTERSVPTPLAFSLTNKKDLQRALDELFKIQSKAWLRAIRGAGSKASLPIHSLYQGDAWVDYWHHFEGLSYSDFMLSEFLPGREFAWQSLWYQGELVSSQARERIEYIFGHLTPSGQTSSPSVARTVNRKDINTTAEASVKAVSSKPHGVFCVDLKEDVTGQPKVTEINAGRFFTTSNFFAHAGLNMPKMYVDLGLGKKIKKDLPKYNPLPENLYWVRMIDMGYKLVEDGAWTARKI